MKTNTFPVILALISVFLGALALPNPDLRIYGLIIFSISFLSAVVWLSYNKINEKLVLVEKIKTDWEKLKENLDVHKAIYKLEERIKKVEATKNERRDMV